MPTRTFTGSVVVDGVTHVASCTVAVDPVPLPPSGAFPVVTYSSLYRTGDADLMTTIRRLMQPSTLLLDRAGVFECVDFAQALDRPNFFGYGIYHPRLAELMSTFGDRSQVVVRMRPRTSTVTAPTSGTNNYTLIRVGRFGNLTLEGTDQGHAYNGFQLYQAVPSLDGRTAFDNLLITGISGIANYPPGETFAINVYRATGTSGDHVRIGGPDLEVSGIRTSDGALVGASPIGWNGCVWTDLLGGYFHDTMASMPTFWQSSDCATVDLRSERCGSGTGQLAGGGINHEESTRITHVRSVLNVASAGLGHYQHMQVMSQTMDCQVTVRAPTFDHPAYVGGQQLTVLIPTNYGSGERVTGNLIDVTDARGVAVPTKIYH